MPKEKYQRRPENPTPRIGEISERKQREDKQPSQEFVTFANKRVQNMAAVQLSDRHKVQSRGQDTRPCSASHRMDQNVGRTTPGMIQPPISA